MTDNQETEDIEFPVNGIDDDDVIEFTANNTDELKLAGREIVQIGREKTTDTLIKFVKPIPVERLIDICKAYVESKSFPTVMDYVLCGLDRQFDKKFKIILEILKEMATKELKYKQVFDVSNHINIELPHLEMNHKAELVDFCVESIRGGDEKFLCWKEILPELLEAIMGEDGTRVIAVNKVEMSANAYISKIVDDLFLMKWHMSIFPVIIEMFSECRILSREDRIKIVKKACDYIIELNPIELPPIAFQLYRLCTTSHTILLAILCLQRFFNRHRYNKPENATSSETDLNFIEACTEKEIRESEQMVLSHLIDWAENSGDEYEIVEAFRFLAKCPEYIMTPFMFAALLGMSCINRYPDTARMLESPIITYLCKIIKSLEKEKLMAQESRYCNERVRAGSMYSVHDVLKILVENSKYGMENITNGLVNLSFYLLKNEKQLQMQSFAIGFLQTFIKHRPMFGSGLIKKLIQFLRSNQKCYQYAECLTSLSLLCPQTVLQCKEDIQRIIDMFEIIEGIISIRMMSFVLPLFKQSHSLRDRMMGIMAKVCGRSQLEAIKMCVFGYCAILKQLSNKNASKIIGTLATASQCSFLSSQSIIVDITQRTQASQRGGLEGGRSLLTSEQRFNIMVIDILTVLKKCLYQDASIKNTLYDNLTKAGHTNTVIIPHITFFIEPHFYRYFRLNDDDKLEIKFDSIIREEERTIEEKPEIPEAEDNDEEEEEAEVNEKDTDTRLMPPPPSLGLPIAPPPKKMNQKVVKELVLVEDLGKLLQFVTQMFVRYEDMRLNHNLDPFMTTFDRKQPFSPLGTMKETFDHLVREVTNITPENLDITGGMDQRKAIIACQLLNVLEGAMVYCAWACTPENAYIQNLSNICDNYFKFLGYFKKMDTKKAKNGPSQGSSQGSSQSNESTAEFKPKISWDFWALQRLLLIIFDEQNTEDWSTEEELKKLRTNKEFKRILMKAVNEKVLSLMDLPEYFQVKHSKRQFENVSGTTKIIYDTCLIRLSSLATEVDMQLAQGAVEILKSSLEVMEKFYSKKYEKFYHTIAPNITLDDETCKLLVALQTAADNFMANWNGKDSAVEKIIIQLFKCIEHIHKSLDIRKNSEFSQVSFEWFFSFCKNNEIQSKNLAFINKILYSLHLRYRSENYLGTVAANFCRYFDYFTEKTQPLTFTLKSITKSTKDICFVQLVEVIEMEIDDVEYFLKKCRSIYDKVMLIPSDKSEKANDQMKVYERTNCSEMVHLSYALAELANIIPSKTTYARVQRMLYRHYVNMTNFLKQLLARRENMKISYRHLDLRNFAEASKPLSMNLQLIIPYIEDNLAPKKKAKKGRKKAKKNAQEEEEEESEESEEEEEVGKSDDDDENSNDEQENLDDDEDSTQPKKAKKPVKKKKANSKTKNLPNVIHKMEAFQKLLKEIGPVAEEQPLGTLKTIGTMRDFGIGGCLLTSNGPVAQQKEPQGESTNCSELSIAQNSTRQEEDAPEPSVIDDNVLDPQKVFENLAKLNKNVSKGKPEIIKKKISKRKPSVPKINKRILENMEEGSVILKKTRTSLGSDKSTNASRFKTTLN